jgi:hypothetical protein
VHGCTPDNRQPNRASRLVTGALALVCALALAPPIPASAASAAPASSEHDGRVAVSAEQGSGAGAPAAGATDGGLFPFTGVDAVALVGGATIMLASGSALSRLSARGRRR